MYAYYKHSITNFKNILIHIFAINIFLFAFTIVTKDLDIISTPAFITWAFILSNVSLVVDDLLVFENYNVLTICRVKKSDISIFLTNILLIIIKVIFYSILNIITFLILLKLFNNEIITSEYFINLVQKFLIVFLVLPFISTLMYFVFVTITHRYVRSLLRVTISFSTFILITDNFIILQASYVVILIVFSIIILKNSKFIYDNGLDYVK